MFMFVTKPQNAEKAAKLTISKWELNNLLNFIHHDLNGGPNDRLQSLWDALSHVDLLDESDGTVEVDLGYEDMTALFRILLAINEKQLNERNEKGFCLFWDNVVVQYKNTHPDEG